MEKIWPFEWWHINANYIGEKTALKISEELSPYFTSYLGVLKDDHLLYFTIARIDCQQV